MTYKTKNKTISVSLSWTELMLLNFHASELSLGYQEHLTEECPYM